MADTIYFAGTEDVDFLPYVGTISLAVNPAFFRSAFVRCANSTLATAAADPPTNRILTPTFTANSLMWVHAQVASNGATGLNVHALQVLDGGVGRIVVRGTATDGQYKIATRNAAGTITDLVTSTAVPITSPVGFDLFINYAVAGQVTLYIGGVQVATFSGDVTTNGATTLNQVMLSNPCTASFLWSEVIVANADTRGKSLWQLNTTGSTGGNVDQWTGALANVNKNAINDATWISTSTNNQIQEYTVATAPTGAYNVDAVVMAARSQIGTTGPQHIQFVTRLGGADFVSSNFSPNVGTFTNLNNYIQATNPNTGIAWLLGDITAAGVNYGIKSTA